MELTKEYLNERFSYCDGRLIWKQPSFKQRDLAGYEAGYVHTQKSGYKCRMVWLDGSFLRVHRLIYIMHHGFAPKSIDHIDGNSLNNRIENLRPATAKQNQQNSALRKDNKSGVKGVKKCKNKWRADIKIDGKQTYLRLFATIEEASSAIKATREKYHGEFARHEEKQL